MRLKKDIKKKLDDPSDTEKLLVLTPVRIDKSTGRECHREAAPPPKGPLRNN